MRIEAALRGCVSRPRFEALLIPLRRVHPHLPFDPDMAPTTRLATKTAAEEKAMRALLAVMDWASDERCGVDDVTRRLGGSCTTLHTKYHNHARSLCFLGTQSRDRFEAYAESHPEALYITGQVYTMTGWHAGVVLRCCPMIEDVDSFTGYLTWDAAHVFAQKMRELHVDFETEVTGPFDDVPGSATKTLWVHLKGGNVGDLGKALASLKGVEELHLSWSDIIINLVDLAEVLPGSVRLLYIDGSLAGDDVESPAYPGLLSIEPSPGVKELVIVSGSHGWLNLYTEAAFPSLERLSLGYNSMGKVEALPILSSLPNSVRVLECDDMPFGFFADVEVVKVTLDKAIDVYRLRNIVPRVTDIDVFQKTTNDPFDGNMINVGLLEFAFPWLKRLEWSNGFAVLNGSHIEEVVIGRRCTGYLMGDSRAKKIDVRGGGTLQVTERNEHLEELKITNIDERELSMLPSLRKLKFGCDTMLSTVDTLCKFHGFERASSGLGANQETEYMFELNMRSVLADIHRDKIVFTVEKFVGMGFATLVVTE